MNKIKIILENEIVGEQNPFISITNRFDSCFFRAECKNGEQKIVTKCDLAPVDMLKISLTEKIHIKNSEVQTTISIKEIYIDSINLQHIIYRGTFYPNYDHNFFAANKPPYSFTPGTTMHHNGVFALEISQPISKFLIDSYEQNA